MGRLVTIATGYKDVALPNNQSYSAGVSVILTDEEWAEVDPHAVGKSIIDGGSYGSGSTLVAQSNVALGTQAGGQTGFTYYPVTGVCKRGLLYRLTITASGAGAFSLDVRDAPAGGGNYWLQATGADTTYDISVPVYLNGDSTGAIYVGIKNTGSASRTYTLTTLGVEKFA